MSCCPAARCPQRLRALGRAAAFYGWWYPTRWLGWGRWPRYAEFGPLARHLRRADRSARRLARSVFHAMLRYGPKLEHRQAVLFRLVDVGAELFAISATCARAQALRAKDPIEGRAAVELADLFARHAWRRVAAHFRALTRNDDARTYHVARGVLAGEHAWLERGMAEPG